MRLKKQTILHIIEAIAVLHNLCIFHNDETPEEVVIIADENEIENEVIVPNVMAANNYRNIFINNLFI